ncbi:MAG: DUF4317 family protein [Lachnospiraceae bacterium]|nr:DUF4317 family protein [Lachnospiraceae bacterium]
MKREDLLELTRRMNLQRNCFHRIAGCYFDENGDVDGTFNIDFRNLKTPDKTKNIAIAKTIPFSRTDDQLLLHAFSRDALRPGTMWQLLNGMVDCGLKNDAMMDVFYDLMADDYQANGPYAIYVFDGVYDVPVKAKDGESLYESEEVYHFLICAVCPTSGDYEPGKPEFGFLFPAFVDRSGDPSRICVFHENPDQVQKALLVRLLK